MNRLHRPPWMVQYLRKSTFQLAPAQAQAKVKKIASPEWKVKEEKNKAGAFAAFKEAVDYSDWIANIVPVAKKEGAPQQLQGALTEKLQSALARSF